MRIPAPLRPLPALAALILLALVTPLSASAQAPRAEARALPMTDEVRTGVLDNGLTWFVQANGRPEARAELRLVVNAGSVLETDAQRGLAHLLEHMAFNGTESFEKQELVDYLESIGMAFGPSINAYTSFDETVYMLRVPTDDTGEGRNALDTGLQILEEWAHKVTLDPEEVDKERGVVIEEWRLGRGAQARISEQQLPIFFAGSRYADRLPIGDVETLRSFEQEEIEAFYERWYRPDLMAVIAVGDFDPDEVEAKIRERFSAIPAPTTPLDRPYYTVPDQEETRFAIATDPELPQAQVGILTMQPADTMTTIGDFRESLMEQLANGMLNNRLREIAQQADPPFLAAFTGRSGFVRTAGAWQLNAAVEEEGHQRAFRALVTEAERAARHGFTPGELEREKADLLRGFERAYNERENRQSASIAGSWVNHFLQHDVVLSPEVQWEAARAIVPSITLDEVNAVARRNLDPENRIVIATGTEKPEVELPDADNFAGVLSDVTATEIAPYEDEGVDAPLVADTPEPGAIVAEREIASVGVTEWQLSNGAVVWLKPTDFQDDQILLAATSPGGWSLSEESEHTTASNAATFVAAGGVGAFSQVDLQKVLAGKAADVSPSIAQRWERLSGSAARSDLETLFQLTWLRFTAPRADDQAFAALRGQIQSFLANRDAAPTTAFGDTLTATLTQHHPRAAPPTSEAIASVELDEALAFYRERFADGGDFHFVLVGAFEPDELRPLVERWLASLPDLPGEEEWRDLGINPPTGRVEKTVRKGVEPQSRTAMITHGPFDFTDENRVRIRALATILQTRLRETLREDLGGTYSVGASASYEEFPDPTYQVSVQFGADPERVDELKAAVFDEIERLATEGPTALDVEKAIEGARRARETNLRENGWWLAQLRAALEGGIDDPAHLVDFELFEAITLEHVREDARRWLSLDNLVVVTLLPEKPLG
ncbi:MAG: insulinase family protein [Longimicrobiales bacterium]|nr:insulinase family protein [Longimicrobiales bacterium]